jgi:glycosyltransferase involved in cell wall biosynthesis
MRIYICAPDIFSGDAVGNHCLGIARCAKRLGWDAEIYAQRFSIGDVNIKPLEEIFSAIRSDDVLIVSYSILDPFLDRLLQLNCRKICYFHGVTKPELLQDIDPVTAELCRQSIEQLPKLDRFDLVVVNSLNTRNYLSVFIDVLSALVVPPVFRDMPVFIQPLTARNVVGNVKTLLMVGRLVPHKCIEDGIEVLSLLRARGLNVSLSLVGSMPNYNYSKMLINFARSLGVIDYVNFNGTLDDIDLFHCYDQSDILLVTSRHEGFCVPVLEAMHFDVRPFVRSGTAGEELCFSKDVFPGHYGLNKWAEVIFEELDNLGSRENTRDDYTSRSFEILELSDDLVWEKIFNCST